MTFYGDEDFFDYINLKGYSKSYLAHIKAYFKKHLVDKGFNSPSELEKYIKGKSKGIVCIVKAARTYLNYCEKYEKLSLEIIEKYRKFLKIEHNSPDVFVPSDKDVIANYQRARQEMPLKVLYLVLMASGVRTIESLRFLKGYNLAKFKLNSNHVSYSVAELHHTKNINNIYLPLFVYRQLQSLSYNYAVIGKEKRGSSRDIFYFSPDKFRLY